MLLSISREVAGLLEGVRNADREGEMDLILTWKARIPQIQGMHLMSFSLYYMIGSNEVTKGDVTKTFFTLPEYEAWKEVPADACLLSPTQAARDSQNWKCKYYKGLRHQCIYELFKMSCRFRNQHQRGSQGVLLLLEVLTC